jgi:hypothetical protein
MPLARSRRWNHEQCRYDDEDDAPHDAAICFR